MWEKIKNLGFRGNMTRFVQFFLTFDIVLHLLEVASAFYEEAWTTFALTSFHAFIFLMAVYFIGHDHSHHKSDEKLEPLQ